MWIIRWLLIIVAVTVLIGFAVQNSDVKVPVVFYKWETVNDLALWLVLYIAFVAGMLFSFLLAVIHIIKTKLEHKKCKRQVEKLKKELKDMRNVSVEEAWATPKTSSEKSLPESKED
ncbi:MAG: LapA family protein [candidate division KSB1 bacterium]|nr:LapA family protein [candidate division KSB1 bacterium]